MSLLLSCISNIKHKRIIKRSISIITTTIVIIRIMIDDLKKRKEMCVVHVYVSLPG